MKMKSIYLLLVFITTIILTSCDQDVIQDEHESALKISYPQQWKLIKMSGSLVNSEALGEAMEWQESYSFKEDLTFTKRRIREGVLKTASGTFSLLQLTDGNFYELIFDVENELIGTCSGDQREFLWLISEKELKSTWNACDGPGLEYRLIE